jgi:hypothetical protein
MVASSVKVTEVTKPGKMGRDTNGRACKCGYRGVSSPKASLAGVVLLLLLAEE